MKVFGSPGIDSSPDEFGAYSSGAGFRNPENVGDKSAPEDWAGKNPSLDNSAQNYFIGNFKATIAKTAEALRIRRRGTAPWGGAFRSGMRNPVSRRKAGGTVDTNTGADARISGGPGAASSMVRMHGDKAVDRGMKLPVLPNEVSRGGVGAQPTGGFHGNIAAPIVPNLPGLASIIKIVQGENK